MFPLPEPYLFWLGVAGVVVLIAASLLIWIWWLTRRIAANALRALRAAEQIRANTNSIWLLDDVNDVGTRLLHRVASIESNAGAVADVLSRAPASSEAIDGSAVDERRED